ncbi:MAG: cellulase family glycosylhydrolase [Sphingobium sp.]|uniref:cellulase family glycosylhydrolase n=1 Tax=Sphingobium sp. TaxID=1912891 RepID=UPI0029AE080A|nr:cellulase family glycosylhydrolase [Sphingobium sp.]MDX3909652.1 cellulase family glycosylhydrolase [Sphingobium sp.]
MTERWTPEAAHAWFDAQPWLVGCNFTPSYAINQLEMWQPETFRPDLIESELRLAASIGMNAVRVYLHDLLWVQDAPGFLDRVDQFLEIADRHGIRAMLVLFDSCWDPEPALGPQRAPRDGVHNSGWVQSPGMPVLADGGEHGRLENYVKGVVGRFGQDPRVLAWDIWNEPDNGPEVALCDPIMLRAKAQLVVPLMISAFGWARSCDPIQPLTSGIWLGDWSAPDLFSPIQREQTSQSDVISFHNYGTAEDFVTRVKWLKAMGRPLLCTEFMARPAGSTFQAILPPAKEHNVGAFCWGLVKGKTQTHLPWENWDCPLPDVSADTWFHDIFDEMGVPHDPAEVELLSALTAR